MRCASPPASVEAGRSSVRYPTPTVSRNSNRAQISRSKGLGDLPFARRQRFGEIAEDPNRLPNGKRRVIGDRAPRDAHGQARSLQSLPLTGGTRHRPDERAIERGLLILAILRLALQVTLKQGDRARPLQPILRAVMLDGIRSFRP